MNEASTWRSDLAPGTRLGGRFLVIRHVASGGCSRVYLARDEERGDLCVLKLASEQSGPMLRREAHSLARVESERVVGARASGFDGGFEFLALDFIEGPTLEKLRLLRGGKLPVSEALLRLGEIAEGLEAMHLEGLVHADIKGENVLVDPQRGAVLIDLGLGCAVHPGQPAAISGTPCYLPPERALGAFVPAYGLPLLDVYSLAVLAYELLFGKLPVTGYSVEELIEAHAFERPSAPPSHAPLEVARVFERALAKDPELRPATPTEFVDQLRKAFSADATQRLRLLLADDDDAWLTILSLGLSQWFPDAEIVRSRNGVEAVESALHERPSAAIVDAEMPHLDGGRLVRALRARWGPDLPILVVTGSPMSDPGKEARGGANAMLVKPVSPRAVAMTLTNLLDDGAAHPS